MVLAPSPGLQAATGKSITSNSLDFDEFVASMSLDSNWDVASNGYVFELHDAKLYLDDGVDSRFSIVASGAQGKDALMMGNQSGNTFVAISSTGNVGIGTTGPSALLTLAKTNTSGLTDLLINPGTKTSGNLFDLQINNASMLKAEYSVTAPNVFFKEAV